MDYKEMEESVGYGEEYNFYYKDKEFWISQNSDGNYLTEVGGETQEFKNSEDLLNNARINGKSIREIWEEIKSQF
ncbi:hypothetical protein IBB74_14475 [Listeria welshimeri]|uniref:hypothetical protein n=1 Tax=Listeria welshimeri TaxID=1643 RepID=UPI0016235CE3|nr:hypothetical protein [Listeria welshimeri]MBC2333773.1 hypothetical protein [Listeria welshimeri]MBF2704356.1 hypothetical protein [Listeria welshimeri]MBS9350462.1 hypothetical protein [Listeria welshimeri]